MIGRGGSRLGGVLGILGSLLMVLAGILLLPLLVVALDGAWGDGSIAAAFAIPAGISMAAGIALRSLFGSATPSVSQAMLVCALAWFVLSAFGAVPFVLATGADFVDAYFETVSGFTTTGITMFTGLDGMPRSILFWRALTQWVGGLGILTFFLAITAQVPGAHRLYRAETHKVESGRPIPGMAHTVRFLWLLYGAFTTAVVLGLQLSGLSLFDSVCHAFTAVATGGFSPYDASIGHYVAVGLPHYRAVEYILIGGMLLGGTSFMVHYKVIRGRPGSLFRGLEMRLWWSLIIGLTGVVLLERFLSGSFGAFERELRTCLFQVVSILTTTGFATRDIGSPFFGTVARLMFLVMMVVGGCTGSTGGGIKVLRVGVLGKLAGRELRRLVIPRRALSRAIVDGKLLSPAEAYRTSALFFAWVVLLLVGGSVTAFLSDHGALSSFSGMCSALGNIGPCYIPAPEMGALHPGVKLLYVVGMVAGRLEILPVLLLFSRRAWRG
ncbi:TrkH family potassium uptake protein [Candidatus Fermentibacteria bacterium]|nr:TrkH family potassium uptake protein [Candidatus Fermentibacteria bacterium]